jgi:3-oxoacyl-[acyl-carrier-protein] synthase-3
MTTPAITGTGSAVPKAIRRNDDPIFDYLRSKHKGKGLFTGYKERRVLGPDETLAGLMQEAAAAALAAAGVVAGDIDLVVGYASFGSWMMPNDLATMAIALHVPPSAVIMPINSEYANFPHALLVAEGLLATGRATNALIVVGADWTRFVDYHTQPSISAGDGAGAAVMQLTDDPTRWRVKDVAVASGWQYFRGMYVAPDPEPVVPPTPPVASPTFGPPYFHMTDDLGMKAFIDFGVPEPPKVVLEVLARNGLAPAQIALVCHQTSATLIDAWTAGLHPGVFVQTLQTYANMTAASIPVNFDRCASEFADLDHVALLALGPEPSCTVVLLERNAPG